MRWTHVSVSRLSRFKLLPLDDNPATLMRYRVFPVLVLTVLGLLIVPPAWAQDGPNQAGLVIQHGDGSVLTVCVTFEEPSISGLELLRRAGISVSADSSSGLGTTICGLDGEGCNYPDENCFCQCQGASCKYWQYWRLGETWQYSQLGAVDTDVVQGDVDGWVWAEGDPSGGQKPPAITFAEICGAESAPAPPATPSTTRQADTAATATPAQTAVAASPTTSGASAPSAPSNQPTATPPPSSGVAGQLCPANYVLFLAILVVLGGIIAGQLRRG